jgi:hypothetical protein
MRTDALAPHAYRRTHPPTFWHVGFSTILERASRTPLAPDARGPAFEDVELNAKIAQEYLDDKQYYRLLGLNMLKAWQATTVLLFNTVLCG